MGEYAVVDTDNLEGSSNLLGVCYTMLFVSCLEGYTATDQELE